MNETYDAILTRMSDTFTELAGYEPEAASDLAIRMKVLAGEIYSLQSEITWLKRQMFPHTAVGESLDYHARQRGLTRRKGHKATGMVVFMLEMPLEYSFTVPIGTICTTADGALRFVTTQEGRIEQGSTLAWVRCEAEDSGTIYNVAHGAITTLVTYLSVGIRINNSSGFSGGTDDEEDDSLRQRLAESYRNTPNGANAAFYISLAESVEGVQSANAFCDSNNPGYVIVVVGGRGAAIAAETFQQVSALLQQHKPLGLQLLVENTALVPVNISVIVTVKNGFEDDAVLSAVEERIRTFFLDMRVGETFYRAALGKTILETEGVENYQFDAAVEDKVVNASSLCRLNTLTVSGAS